MKKGTYKIPIAKEYKDFYNDKILPGQLYLLISRSDKFQDFYEYESIHGYVADSRPSKNFSFWHFSSLRGAARNFSPEETKYLKPVDAEEIANSLEGMIKNVRKIQAVPKTQ
jgi:hypothetical protein